MHYHTLTLRKAPRERRYPDHNVLLYSTQKKHNAPLDAHLISIIHVAVFKVRWAPTRDGLPDKVMIGGDQNSKEDEDEHCQLTVETITERIPPTNSWITEVSHQIKQALHRGLVSQFFCSRLKQCRLPWRLMINGTKWYLC